ncbi:hypothetical protein FHX81_3796 [Saccharothrix saharensis]|uniref:Uncharacterized protein n=1 Tax=Saccharothrix saharensis TaxID=571190 RepID=A0A543JF94_9PSEU|nr:hypothetical protein [Saccharothrix saharensis]TQM81431.1 hypothetical protein FHX81_3796 [Saccharothrix saharensis]
MSTTKSTKLMPLAVALFALGVAAVVAMFVAGEHGLPAWVFAAGWLLAPAGLALGVLSAVRNARPRPRR